MAKYELVQTTEVNGKIWYNIEKNGEHIDETFTQDIDKALKMFDDFVNGGKPAKPIKEILKSQHGND